MNLMLKNAYPAQKRWRELQAASREAAENQCQFLYKNKKRCSMKHGQLRRSRRGLKYIVYLHTCHLNSDPSNEEPELLCLCAKHHMMLDRRAELREHVTQRRRGYNITTTDILLLEVNSAGITIREESDGFHWWVNGYADTRGTTTTAVNAVATSIHQMRCLLDAQHQELGQAQREIERMKLL